MHDTRPAGARTSVAAAGDMAETEWRWAQAAAAAVLAGAVEE
jgi:hypothetical protein